MTQIEEVKTPEQIAESLIDPDAPNKGQGDKWVEDFQKELLGLLVNDKPLMAATRALLTPAYFTSDIDKEIWRLATAFYDKYNEVPSRTQLAEELKPKIIDKAVEVQIKYTAILNGLYFDFVPVETRDYYKDKIIQWAKIQALKLGFHKCLDELKKKPEAKETWSNINTIISEALSINRKADKRRRAWTISELNNLPDTSYLIDRHFPVNGMGCVFAPPGSFKTFLTLDMALSVASGIPFAGRYGCKQGVVLFVCGEGKRGLPRRISAWLKYNNISSEAIKNTFYTCPAEFGLTTSEEAEAVLSVIKQDLPKKPDLIIIDTLARNFGQGDENSTKDMSAFISNIDHIREETGSAIICVHHTGKDFTKGERGSSALRGACDTIIQIDIKDTIDNRRLIVSCSKQKDDEEFDSYMLKPEKVQLTETQWSVALKYAGTLKDNTKAEVEDTHAQEEAELLIHIPKIEATKETADNGITGKELEAVKEWTHPKISRVLQRLINAGKIRRLRFGKSVNLPSYYFQY